MSTHRLRPPQTASSPRSPHRPDAAVELSLLRQAQAGDAEAYARLLRLHKGYHFLLSHRLAHRYRIPQDEAEQLARLALWQAMRSYRPDRGTCICHWWTIAATGLAARQAQQGRSCGFPIDSPAPGGDSGDGLTLADVLADDGPSPAAEAAAKDLSRHIQQRLDGFDPRLWPVLRDRYGLSGHPVLRVGEIAQALQLTPESIRLFCRAAEALLRDDKELSQAGEYA